jgi:N-acetyl-beta-hexosaminidase
MNPFTAIVGVFLLLRLFNKFMDGYSSKVNSDDNIQINRVTKSPLFNYSNENLVDDSLLSYYTNMLNLSHEPEVNLEILDNHYYRIIQQMENDRDLGLRVNIDVHELVTAYAYMTDMCRYFGNRN